MRRPGFDLARVAACLAVVMIHTVMLFWDFNPEVPTWAVYNWLSLAVRFGVPLFFMLSGALLLGREESWRKLLTHRVRRFALILLIVSAIACTPLPKLLSDQLSFSAVWDGCRKSRIPRSGSCCGRTWTS